jgi:hypothetical protein
MNPWLLNNKPIGLIGASGASASAAKLYADLTDEAFLRALWYSAHYHSDPQHAFAQTIALLIGIGGGLLFAYLGRPLTVPSKPSG